MHTLSGKTAFITGGASGIGLGIAERFVDAGMNVVIADLRQDHLDVADELVARRGRSAQLHRIRVDVTDRAAMAAAAVETAQVFGNLHVLVNNAGIGISGPFDGITYADWDWGLAVNLGGVINGLQSFLPGMRAHGEGGHIVNTASLQAFVPMPSNFVVYVAAKAAVVGISETLRPDLARHGIGMTVLCPGPVRTHIHELRLNRPPQFVPGEAFRKAAENPMVLDLPGMLEPSEVGEMVLQAVLHDDPYVMTHGEWRDAAHALHAARIAAMPTEVNSALLALLRGPRPE
jgi:NAD(P)-dependent dehydrogenase (short-subunit alcohol dehydrogenase family)